MQFPPALSLDTHFSLGTAYAYQFLVYLSRESLYIYTHILYHPAFFVPRWDHIILYFAFFFNTIS